MHASQVNAIGQAEIEKVCAAFKLPIEETKLLGKVQNLVFSVNENAIIRFTHASYRSLEALMGEYEFVEWLVAHGIHAPKAYALDDGGFFLPIENNGERFFASATAKAKGTAVRRSDPKVYNEKTFEIWGRTMAQMHEAVKDFSPKHPRADYCSDSGLSGAINALSNRLGANYSELYTATLEQLSKLGRGKDEYGAVHYDLHCGNFYLDNNSISIFDFDDCARAHFLGDIAVAVYAHTAGRYEKTPEGELENCVDDFLNSFLKGYTDIRPVPSGFKALLPLFMTHRFLMIAVFLIKEFDEGDELAQRELSQAVRAIAFWQKRQNRSIF